VETLNIGNSIVFSSYPAQVALFKYTTLSNDISAMAHTTSHSARPGQRDRAI
jgi:hypothetical protein